MEQTFKVIGRNKKRFQIVFLILILILGLYTQEISTGYIVFFVFGLIHMIGSYRSDSRGIKITDCSLMISISKDEWYDFKFLDIHKIHISSQSSVMLKRDIMYVYTDGGQEFLISAYNVDSIENTLSPLCEKYQVEFTRQFSDYKGV
jgi:hypothetical protein